jgi:glycosyltransferase involved in cell wall biosynthesis
MVKDLDVIYTNTLEPLKFYSILKSGKSNAEIPYGNLGESKGGFFSKVMAFVRANFFIPDARRGWVPFAKGAASQLLKKEKFDWLITTGPPHSTHLAGLFLAEKYQVKWLADFRDPWSEIYFLKTNFRFEYAKQKDLKFESEVLNKANLVITVGPGMADLLKKKMEHPEKLHVLYNGYDKEMFASIEKRSTKNLSFVISHIGLLGDTQKFDSFIEALKSINLPVNQVQIHLAGSVHPIHLEKLKTELADFEIRHEAFLPRKKALELMKNSDLLLLCPPMVGETRLIVSTKTMEYLAAGVPILGIGDSDSDAAHLVKQQSMSGFYNPNDIAEISKFTLKCFENWKSDKILENDFDPEPYSRLAVCNQLANILSSN